MNDEPKGRLILSRMRSLLITLTVLGVIASIMVVAVAYYVVGNYHQYTAGTTQEVQNILGQEKTTAIVFGSGITPDGEPRPILQQRLDAALSLYDARFINRIIVSGYFPYERYNEPKAMEKYLVDNGIPEDLIAQDTNGENTYASCRHAKQEFAVDKAIVITQPSHIDRAIFLCRANHIETYGYPAKTPGDEASKTTQSVREALSNVKALFDGTVSKIKN